VIAVGDVEVTTFWMRATPTSVRAPHLRVARQDASPNVLAASNSTLS